MVVAQCFGLNPQLDPLHWLGWTASLASFLALGRSLLGIASHLLDVAEFGSLKDLAQIRPFTARSRRG